jgi:hypothetical protein
VGGACVEALGVVAQGEPASMAAAERSIESRAPETSILPGSNWPRILCRWQ